MKKLLTTALLTTALTSLLTAGTIFDLSAQHFSNSLDGDGVGGRYDLPKCYVSTALKYTNGIYALTTSPASQTMAVEIKTPPSNWSVSFDMSYHIYGWANVPHPVRITSDTGKTITVTFMSDGIYLNGVRIYKKGFDDRYGISGTVTKTGNSVTCQIAGYVIKTINIENFSKLKFVNVTLSYDNGNDYLNGLNISSSN